MIHSVAFSIRRLTIVIVLVLLLFSCNTFSSKQEITTTNKNIDTIDITDSLMVYNSETLKIQKLSNHIYQHTSYLTTTDFGNVPCNGMLVVNQREAIIFDTPTDVSSSTELFNFIIKNLNCSIIAVIPTHFHNDCVGGLEAFNENNIPVYASNKTIELLKINSPTETKSMNGFADQLTLNVGDKKVMVHYFGEGHTVDNVIGYVPTEHAMFGGCLIKELYASKGYLGDANVNDWAVTVQNIKQQFPHAKIIIPGHGNWGGTELLDYTIQLFK